MSTRVRRTIPRALLCAAVLTLSGLAVAAPSRASYYISKHLANVFTKDAAHTEYDDLLDIGAVHSWCHLKGHSVKGSHGFHHRWVCDWGAYQHGTSRIWLGSFIIRGRSRCAKCYFYTVRVHPFRYRG